MAEASPKDLLAMCLEQEKRLVFPGFSHEDAWTLGCILKDLADRCDRPMGAEIMVNGLLLFRYYPAGATKYYEYVMTRKHNTANTLEKSSLRFYAETQLSGLDPAADMRLDPDRFMFRGGSFPIRLKDGCVIGSVVVAGGDHTEDHAMAVKGIEEFLARKKGA